MTQETAVQMIDRITIDRAWKKQLEAVNAWEFRAERNYPKDLVEAAWDEVEARTAYAVGLEEQYKLQIEQGVQ